MKPTVAVALTGASGMPYGLRLIESLIRADARIYLLYSQAAHVVANGDGALEWLRSERVLVLDMEEAAGRERLRRRVGPRRPPCRCQALDARVSGTRLERVRAHVSSGMPSVGVDGSA